MGVEKEKLKTVKNICKAFKIEGKMIGFEEIKIGHINNTFCATYKNKGVIKKYIVQQINLNVFKEPLKIMKNIDLVTEHIRKAAPNETLHFHHCLDGKNYYIDGKTFWRLYTMVDGYSYTESINVDIMKQAGTAFGHFQVRLKDFDANQLSETIPDFHNTKKRFEHLLKTIKDDPCGRVGNVEKEIEFAKEYSEIALKINDGLEKGLFPIRATHNDTKINNVILGNTKDPLVVIDLDTLMPGLIMHDFGDAIRSGANVAKEDEVDQTKIRMSLDLFKAFADGFIAETCGFLTENEIKYMSLGAITMTYEVGIRFLDDYLSGDKYFKTKYPEHNLVRCRSQFALAKDMKSKLGIMDAIVNDIIKNK